MTTSVELSVVDDVEEGRYEARLGTELVAFIHYHLDSERITLIHTQVDRAHEGEGIASRLIGEALDDIRQRGLTVVPMCPFVRGYVQRHPEYADLVAST